MAKTQSQAPSQDAVRLRSYVIWEREGRPDGYDVDHWLRTKSELEAQLRVRPARRKASTTKSAGKSARGNSGGSEAHIR